MGDRELESDTDATSPDGTRAALDYALLLGSARAARDQGDDTTPPELAALAGAALRTIEEHAPADASSWMACAAGCPGRWPCPTVVTLAATLLPGVIVPDRRRWALCVGGPWHGREVLATEPTMVVSVADVHPVPSFRPDDGRLETLAEEWPKAVRHTYDLKVMGLTRPGSSRTTRRFVYLHDSIYVGGRGGDRVAKEDLGRILIDRWIETGQEWGVKH